MQGLFSTGIAASRSKAIGAVFARALAPKKDTERQTIGSMSAESLFLKILLYIIGFVGSIVVSRTVGPEGRGLYYLPMVAATTVAVFAKLGLQNANVYLLGTRGISVDRLTGQNGLVAWVMGSIGVLALLQASWVLPSVFGQTPPTLLLLAALTIPFSVYQMFSNGLLNLLGVVTWQFRASLISGVVQLVVLVTLGLSGHLNPVSVVAVALMTQIFGWWLTQLAFDAPNMFRVRFDIALLRETLSNSLILHLGMVLYYLHLRLDTFMVQAMAGSATLGQYSVAVMFAETMLMASDSLAVSILPRQVGDNLRDSALLAMRGSRMNVLISLVLGLGLAVTGYWVIRLFYGSAFTPSFLPLIALLPGMTALGVQRCTGGPVLRVGAPWKFAAIYGVSVLCNVGLNLLLIPALGITGAALASSVSYSIEALLFLAWVAQISGARITEGLIPNKADAARLFLAAREIAQLLTRLASARRLTD